MRLVPVTLTESKRHVARHHRHNRPPLSGLFSIGLSNGSELVGVAIVGRPVARGLQDGISEEYCEMARKRLEQQLLPLSG
jgi:hypothetical protein